MFRWGRLAFGSAVKALGFVVLAEGMMTFCATAWLSGVALGYLVLINAIATWCTIALGAVQDQRAAAATTAAPVAVSAVDGSAQLMAALASLESRLAARDIAPLVLQPTKGTRKRIRKPNTRQLRIIPERPEGLPGAGSQHGAVAAVAWLPTRRPSSQLGRPRSLRLTLRCWCGDRSYLPRLRSCAETALGEVGAYCEPARRAGATGPLGAMAKLAGHARLVVLARLLRRGQLAPGRQARAETPQFRHDRRVPVRSGIFERHPVVKARIPSPQREPFTRLAERSALTNQTTLSCPVLPSAPRRGSARPNTSGRRTQ